MRGTPGGLAGAALCGLACLAMVAAVAPPGPGASPVPPAAPSERRPLQRLNGKLGVQGPGYSIVRDANGGEIVVEVRNGGKALRLSYQPPDDLEATVETSVELIADPPSFVYSYRLANSPTSRQRATDLAVELVGAARSIASPPGWDAKMLTSISALAWSSSSGLAAGGTAAGFAFTGYDHDDTETLDTPAGVLPGFVHPRGSLPGIVSCYVVGSARLPAALSTPASALVPVVAALPRFPRNGVAGKTVGPVEAPAENQLPRVLAALRQYAKASLELGWIERRDTADRYARALAAVDGSYSGGDPARRSHLVLQLQAIENQVDVDSRRRELKPEAYALLKYNSWWLRRWVSEQR